MYPNPDVLISGSESTGSENRSGTGLRLPQRPVWCFGADWVSGAVRRTVPGTTKIQRFGHPIPTRFPRSGGVSRVHDSLVCFADTTSMIEKWSRVFLFYLGTK